MEEGKEKYEAFENNDFDKVFSKAVRAGKRTYFFDVKVTKRNDYYVTITESKKRFHSDGRYFYEKHKVFLYKEDFEKFLEGLNQVIDFIESAEPEVSDVNITETTKSDVYTNVDFDDLEKVDIAISEEEKE